MISKLPRERLSFKTTKIWEIFFTVITFLIDFTKIPFSYFNSNLQILIEEKKLYLNCFCFILQFKVLVI